MRYVVDSASPFIVGQGGPIYSGKPVPSEQPFGTLTTENHRAVVIPSIVPVTHQGSDRIESVHEPFRTITSAQRGEKALAVATLVQTGYGEREGQAPRALDIGKPLGTVVAGGGKAALVTAFLNEHANASNQRVMSADEPLRTICAQVKGGHFSLVTAHVTKFRTGATGSSLDEPLHTITAGPKENPAGSAHAMGLIKLRGTSSTAGSDEPLHTISAGGQHHAEVRAFLVKYYGTDQDPRLDEPLHTVTTKDRYGLVTIQGVDYAIVDIGLRMLQPKELYLAQGFPANYIFEEIPDPELLFIDGYQSVEDPLSLPRKKLTKSSQVRMCGNSVCPPLAEALVRANFKHEQQFARAA